MKSDTKTPMKVISSYQDIEDNSVLVLLSDDENINKDSSEDLLLKTDPVINNKSITVTQNESLHFELLDFTSFSSINNIDITLEEGASVFIKGAVLNSNDNSSKKYNINIVHKGPSSTSYVDFYGLNNSSNVLDFELIASILNKSKKSDTNIQGRITNIHKKARSRVLPLLKISENDVKAKHGAYLGTIDESSLYYLTSRGLTLDESKRLIVLGYFKPLISSITDTNLKDKLLNLLETKTI